MRLCFVEADVTQHGLPASFRRGVLEGFVNALDEAVANLVDDESPRVQRVVDALGVVRTLFPEADAVNPEVQ